MNSLPLSQAAGSFSRPSTLNSRQRDLQHQTGGGELQGTTDDLAASAALAARQAQGVHGQRACGDRRAQRHGEDGRYSVDTLLSPYPVRDQLDTEEERFGSVRLRESVSR